MLYNQPRTTMFRGEETPIAKVAEELGLPYSRVYARTTRRETGDMIEANPDPRKPYQDYFKFNGESGNLKTLVAKYGSITLSGTKKRLQRGWSLEKALTTPPGQKRNKGAKE